MTQKSTLSRLTDSAAILAVLADRAAPAARLYRRLRTLLACCVFFLSLTPAASADDEIVRQMVEHADFTSAREALVEAIETEGLVIGQTLPFADMLARTASVNGDGAPENPYLNAAVIQFCSARIAWRLVTENPTQIALCPFSVAIYVERRQPDAVIFAYRRPYPISEGTRMADTLLKRVVEKAIPLAR